MSKVTSKKNNLPLLSKRNLNTIPMEMKIKIANYVVDDLIKNMNLETEIKKGNLKNINLILKFGNENPGKNENSAIRLAAKNGKYAIVKRLLADSRVDPSDCHNAALHWARHNYHTKIINLLLKDKRVKNSL